MPSVVNMLHVSDIPKDVGSDRTIQSLDHLTIPCLLETRSPVRITLDRRSAMCDIARFSVDTRSAGLIIGRQEQGQMERGMNSVKPETV